MPTLSEIFDKRKILLYQNESLDLDHYYQEPYQDENDEIKDMGKPFETDESKKIRTLDLSNEDRTYSGFSYFMDGSRRTYKIGDMVLEGKKIFPVVVAAGSSFFYKAFGNNLEEYYELLAMPRELIMFRSHFEENGTTAKWQTLYRKLNDEQKRRLMDLVSLNVSELRKAVWPDDLKDILEFYLIKYSGKKEYSNEKYV